MNPSLEQLKDIHLPAEISWWPPAPGWWLVLLLVVSLLVGLQRYWRYRSGKKCLQRQSQKALSNIRDEWRRHQDARQLVSQLSLLLRQVAISKYPGSDVAGKTGESWLRWLDQQMGTQEFEKGDGRLLLDAPYRPQLSLKNGDALITLVKRCIDRIAGEGDHA